MIPDAARGEMEMGSIWNHGTSERFRTMENDENDRTMVLVGYICFGMRYVWHSLVLHVTSELRWSTAVVFLRRCRAVYDPMWWQTANQMEKQIHSERKRLQRERCVTKRQRVAKFSDVMVAYGCNMLQLFVFIVFLDCPQKHVCSKISSMVLCFP